MCPAWAGGFGIDRFGVFADLVWDNVVQRFRWIEPGVFQMGSTTEDEVFNDDEMPKHSVIIKDGFWMGDTPVTQQFYEAVTTENPSHFWGKEKGEHPVEKVDWHESSHFCKKVTENFGETNPWVAKLPSEAQWEYVSRAGSTGGKYSDEPLEKLDWFNKNSKDSSQSVKGKLPNKWGLYDTLGNVFEWCEDEWYENYRGAPTDGSVWMGSGEKGRGRVIRGGGWDRDARRCRPAFRYEFKPGFCFHYLGFRLLLAHRETGVSPFIEQAGQNRW